ncbi:hypothetical protein BpHYR1_028378 [Brachionus plicatilis]|uniref:Uncharacterized protein n=1 Tax=Brachionus plicatilis TaxID=10195 RepID=A0A3M7QPY8_BRAPC|nr:hypothetical protein BpHYR1_028378 [Brachionus plicatilis]
MNKKVFISNLFVLHLKIHYTHYYGGSNISTVPIISQSGDFSISFFSSTTVLNKLSFKPGFSTGENVSDVKYPSDVSSISLLVEVKRLFLKVEIEILSEFSELDYLGTTIPLLLKV